MKSIVEEIAAWSGTTSLEELFEFCDRLCQVYSGSDADDRDAMRKTVAANEHVRGGLLHNTLYEVGPGGFLVEAARRADEAGDHTSYLRRALLAISLTDGFDDSRDTLMWLADLWRSCEAHGVDPDPLYEEIGVLSSMEPIHMIGGPTAFMIRQVRQPHRRDQLKSS